MGASRGEVFRAWTEANLFREWFAPPGVSTTSAELDVRVGGRWRVAMTTGARRWHGFGEYVEVDPPSRLVFTFGWEGEPFVRLTDSIVTVDFSERDGDTEVVITHERLTPPVVAFHAWGWRACLENLARRVPGTPPGTRVGG